MKGRKDFNTGRLRWPSLVVITVLVLCVVSVHADYWAGIGDNGQYSVTYTENPDGSASIQGAAVGPGGTITELSNSGNQQGSCGGDSSTGVSQNLEISGPDGWAEVIFKDASDGNESHVEMESNGDVFVHQYAGEYTDSHYCRPVETGITSEQCIWSNNFTSITASAYSLNADGSGSLVTAAATDSENYAAAVESSYGTIDPYSAIFCVHQESGVVTSLTSQNKKFSYSGYSVPTTTAEQDVMIIGADTASAIATSRSSDGTTATVTANALNNAVIPNLPTTYGGYGPYECSKFNVDQETGTGITTVSGSNSYSYNYGSSLSTYANQDGCIKDYDNTTVSADSSLPQGFTSQAFMNAHYGDVNFDMDAAAGQSWWGSYKTTAGGDVSVSGCHPYGVATAESTGPNDEYADVTVNFARCGPGFSFNPIRFDLTSSTKLENDGDYSVNAGNCWSPNSVYRPAGYIGNITASATNSAPDTTTFNGKPKYYGYADVDNTGSSDTHTWSRY